MRKLAPMGGKVMARRKRALEVVRSEDGGAGKPSRRNRLNFFELAYQKIEELLGRRFIQSSKDRVKTICRKAGYVYAVTALGGV